MRAVIWIAALSVLCACGGEDEPMRTEPDAGPRAEQPADPGRVTLHRLNRAEYNNTVRDLFSPDLRPAADFPADDHGYGFDNNADVLALSPFQVELYARAAENLVTVALAEARTAPDVVTVETEHIGSTSGALWRDSGWQLRTGGAVGTDVPFPAAGRYTFTIHAFGAQADPRPLTLALRVGGLVSRVWQVSTGPESPGEFTTTLELEAGTQLVEAVVGAGAEDRALVIDRFAVTGPAVGYAVVLDTNGAALDAGGEFGRADREAGVYAFWAEGTLEQPLTTAAGAYRVSVSAAGDQAGTEPVRLEVLLDGAVVATFDVEGSRDLPEIFSQTAELNAGQHVLGLRFANDFWNEDEGEDRNLHVGSVLVEGPLDEPPINPVRQRILACDGPAGSPACAEEILARFLRRAWRRPPSGAELDRYRALVASALAQGDSFESGVSLALRAALTSPHFLFRVEIDPGVGPHALTDHELASRLSYFLWSSMPDDELLDVADAGMLQDDDVLAAQTTRMLADPKARAFTDNFAGQWLQTRALFDVVPDYNVFPAYDEALKYGLYEETAAFFESFLHSDLPVTQMFTARYTFANARVANHYGIDGVDGVTATRIELDPDTHRRGLLTQGAILTVTAYPTRTSPVKRGKWVLSQMLCSEPPPPPPGVEGLIEQDVPSGTLREQLEQHRADPTCASCHALMDPIGFAMEAYDAIGVYRTQDRGFPLDTSGELVTGESFTDVYGLADILAEDERVTRCVTRHMTTYALGRGLEFDDKPLSDAIHAGFVADGASFSALVHHIVQSRLFRWRSPEDDQ